MGRLQTGSHTPPRRLPGAPGRGGGTESRVTRRPRRGGGTELRGGTKLRGGTDRGTDGVRRALLPRSPLLLAGLLLFVILMSGGTPPLPAQESDVFSREPNALGAQNTSRNQGGELRGGLYYQHWGGSTGYLLTASVLRDETARTAYSDATLFAYELRGDLMRRVFAGDVAEWLSGALFLFGSLGHDGRIDVDVADLEDVDAANPDEFEPSEPERSVQPFTPGLTGAVGVGFEVALLSHYSLLFQLGYGPAVDLYPFKLRFFGLSFTFGTGIRF